MLWFTIENSSLKIRNAPLQASDIIAKHSQTSIAPKTKQAANLVGFMIVVNKQTTITAIAFLAKSTESVLLFQQGFEAFVC